MSEGQNNCNRFKLNIKQLCLIGLSILFGLACGTTDLSQILPATAAPTATPTLTGIEIKVIAAGGSASSVDDPQPSSTPIPLYSSTRIATPSPPVVIIPTDTPSFPPTVTPSPTLAQPISSADSSATPTIAPTQTEVIAGEDPDAPPDPTPGSPIKLIEIPDKIVLLAEPDPVEFKWVWKTEETLCQSLPEDQGFDIRIWPDAPDAAGPLGAVKIITIQEDIQCDEKSGTRMFKVEDLRSSPGVQEANGAGQFRWNVALIDLTSPFDQHAVSESRTFQLPPLITPTPIPTHTPIPRVCACDGGVGGEIILEELEHETSLPPDVETVEFQWRWSASDTCEMPPRGYGFEVRIWPEHPDFDPMGAMGDAAQSQADIFCDPDDGIYKYRVVDFKNTPGVQRAGAGRFYWHVILFEEEPSYREVVLSERRIFSVPGVSKLEE